MRRSKRAQGATPAGAGDPVASSERAREAAQRTPGTPARARAPPPASSPATPAVGAPSRDASAARTRRELQRERIASAPGFIAALDQSGGSTPRALAAYGITDIRGDEAHMFALVHDMRTRILTADAFSSERIIGAILFEDTVFNRLVEGLPTATYAWNEKGIVPFLKIDKGLEPEKDGVRLMKPIPDLADLLARRAPPDARRVVGQRLHLLELEHGLLRRELIRLDRRAAQELVADVLFQSNELLQCCLFHVSRRPEDGRDLVS